MAILSFPAGCIAGPMCNARLFCSTRNFAEKLGQALAALFSDAIIAAVVSPALGGVIIGQEVASALPEPKGSAGRGVPAIFAERDASGTMTLRRGFSLKPMSTFW